MSSACRLLGYEVLVINPNWNISNMMYCSITTHGSNLSCLLLLVFCGCAGMGERNHYPRVSHDIAAPTYGPTDELATTVQTVAFSDEETELSKVSLGPLNISMIEIAADEFPSQPTTYTLSDIEQIALNNNPAIAAAGAASSVAAGFRQQVGVRPNPIFGYWGSQLADQQTEQNGVFFEQEFVRGNKLALNQEVLKHTVDAQRWEVETQRYRVLTDVRVRFYEALAAQHQLDATNEFAKVAQRGVEVALARQDAQEGTLIDVLQSKTLMSEINLAIQQSEAAYQGAWKDLAAIAGIPNAEHAPLAAEFGTFESTPNWEMAYTEITSQSPELAAANALVCEKYAYLKRQQVQKIPNVTAQFGTGYDRATDSGLINLQIGAPLPLFNKNTGNISAAYSDYTLALENVKRIELGIKSRLARAAQEFDSSFAAVKKYEQEIVPQAKQALELSEEAYRAGELDFLQVLVVRRVYYESTIRLIAAQGQLAQAVAKVDGLVLLGGLDAPKNYTTGDVLRGQSLGGQ